MSHVVVVVVCDLHRARDALPVTEDLVEVLGAQGVPQSCLCQQPGKDESVSQEVGEVFQPGARRFLSNRS